MKTSHFSVLLLLAALFQTACIRQTNEINREIYFNNNWKFIRADAKGAEKPAFDDSGWRTLHLPHDYSIEDLPDPKTGNSENEELKQIGPFSEASAGGASTGHVVGGTAWYRKHFTLSKTDKGKIIKILFDGVYMNAGFWINGHHLGNHPYGYTAFAFDLTEFLNPAGEENVLAVKVKNEGENSRWYSGSGIYRNVTLIKTHPVYIDLWGNYITTPKVSREKATVRIETKVINASAEIAPVTVFVRLQDKSGNAVASSEKVIQMGKGDTVITEQEITVNNPELWDTGSPGLYSAVVQLKKSGKLIDQTSEKFGIRSIDFTSEKGFLLNGKNVLLKGGCLHHDNGPLGAAAFDRAEYRRVKIMKENGFNAIRTAHNPPSEAFLDACDELGMLVMNESFDQWQRPKKPQDYSQYFDDWWEKDLESMVLRDRNHPSVIIWSVGNEIKERADSSGLEIFRNLRAKVLELDNTRPVTQAICSFWETPGRPWKDTEPAFAQMDVHSYNYQWQKYETDHEKFPGRIMIGTESFPMEAFENWQMVEKHPYVIGDFVWTGMDYFGESGIGSSKLDNEDIPFLPPWPWFNAYCGDISILGYKKPQMYYRDVVWRNSDLEMLVHAPVPEGRTEVVSRWGWPEEWKNWTWDGHEGKPLQVSVYTRCDEVRLELNGEVVETKQVPKQNNSPVQMENPTRSRDIRALAARFRVPYQPGKLVAAGLKNGKEVARQILKTADQPAKIRISAERKSVSASPANLAYFNIEVVDEKGLPVPDAVVPVEFEIAGAGQLQAVGNGNPKDMKSFQQPRVNTFRGKCQLIVRCSATPGEIFVTARSEGLENGTAKVEVL